MATPLHHDQPQRALQTLGMNRGGQAEKSSRSSMMKLASPHKQDDNLANQPDASYRSSPRPLHHLQPPQNLRQRRSNSPHAPLDEKPRQVASSPQSLEQSSSNRPHAKSLFKESRPDHPHTESTIEIHINHARTIPKESRLSYPNNTHMGNSREGHSHHAFVSHPVVNTYDNQIYRVNLEGALSSWRRHQPELPSSDALNPIDSHAKEGDKHHPSQSLVKPNSHPRDYKAAVMRENSVGHALKHHQHVNHDNYFGCIEDDKQKIQSKRLVKAIEQRPHVVLDSSSEVRHGNTSDTLLAVVTNNEQIERLSHIATPFSDQSTLEDQAETTAEVDHMASEQELHRELSHLSSDDSYCHISKEAVEREYQKDCHLAASSEYQAQSQQEPCSRLVYDYSQAGVTFDADDSKEQQSDYRSSIEKDPSNEEESIPDDCHKGKSVHDDLKGHDDLQQQDVESPPLFLGFNYSSTRFACGTSKGVRVYDVNTMRECLSCMIGGVGLVELLLNTDSFLLVGGGPNPSFPVNKVVMWDAVKGRSVGQIRQKFPILAVKAGQDRLVAVLENEVYVYNLINAELLFQVNTTSNMKGLCALSTKEGPSVLACPGLKKGEVRIEHIGTNRKQGEMPTRDGIDISAHDSGLACINLNLEGSLLATASDRGTLVRIFGTKDGAPLQELRRGSDRAEIYSLAFSFSSDWLAVSSDKGTVHIFGVKTVGLKSTDSNGASPTFVQNPGSTLSFIKGVLPKYFRSEWSYAQFKLPEEMKSVVAFGQEKNSILVLGIDGSFHKCFFDSEHGGDMKQLEFLNFMKSSEAEA